MNGRTGWGIGAWMVRSAAALAVVLAPAAGLCAETGPITSSQQAMIPAGIGYRATDKLHDPGHGLGRSPGTSSPLVLVDPGTGQTAPTGTPETLDVGESPQPHTETLEETARKSVRSFREQLMGQSMILGVSHALVNLGIQTSGGTSIENYHSASDLTPTVMYYSAPKEFQRLWPDSKWSAAWVLDYGGAFGGFSGKQSEQTLANGQPADGKVYGDYAYAVIGTSMWFIRDDPVIPVGIRLTGDIGLGTVQYSGDLNYSVGNQSFSGTIQNDGTSIQFVNYAGVELRVWQLSLSAFAFDFFGNGPSILTSNGEKLASYQHTFRMDIYTLGYVFVF